MSAARRAQIPQEESGWAVSRAEVKSDGSPVECVSRWSTPLLPPLSGLSRDDAEVPSWDRPGQEGIWICPQSRGLGVESEVRTPGAPVVAQRIKSLTRIHEDAGSIPGLLRWVKDPALPSAVV